MTTAEEQLAAFVVRLQPDELPADVAALVRMHILDAIACGLAGVAAEHSSEVRVVATTIFGDGQATVIGGRPLAPAGAVLVNGFQIAAPTLGDVHRRTLTHVMPEVLPAALAASQVSAANGRRLLAGVAAGLELTVRIAEALDTDEYRSRAFHNPGIAGAVGAACAAARVLGVDERGVRLSIGHAASQAAGTFAALGTAGVKLHQARGGLSGFLSAALAERADAGIDASDQALTAERGGLLNAYAGGGHPERLTDGLGGSWRLAEIAMRRWPGASSLQPVIEATLAIRAEIGARAARSAVVRLPPRAYTMHGRTGWQTRLSALQSARWTVAVALADGEMWLEQTADDRRMDVNVARFAHESVSVEEDPQLPPTGARVTVATRDGRDLTRQVDVPPGDPQRPLSEADIEEKLSRAAAGVGLGDRVPSIVDAVRSLAAARSVGALTDALEVR